MWVWCDRAFAKGSLINDSKQAFAFKMIISAAARSFACDSRSRRSYAGLERRAFYRRPVFETEGT